MANVLGATIEPPRVSAQRRQNQRANVPFDTAEEYYRRAVYCPFLDDLIEQLNSRFSETR